ncbi:hypothetical protein ACRAWD_02565 [Caulobacter segnis]
MSISEPGRWTHVRIVVAGPKAILHVDRAEQPTLIVGDLKHRRRRKGRRGAVDRPRHAGPF